MDIFQLEPQSLLGTWRRFGDAGPAYEIVGIGAPDDDGARRMLVRMPETDEEVLYRLDELLDDPVET